MKKVLLEEIYSLFEVDYDECDSIDVLLGIMREDCALIEEDKELAISAKKLNNFDIFITKVQNIFGVFGEDDYEWIEEDNVLLDEQYNLSCKYLGYYNKLVNIINEENYKDIYKLVNFMGFNYVSNFEYFETMRDSINLASRGIGFSSSDGSYDTREEFEELFNNEYNRISVIKPVQKKK